MFWLVLLVFWFLIACFPDCVCIDDGWLVRCFLFFLMCCVVWLLLDAVIVVVICEVGCVVAFVGDVA